MKLSLPSHMKFFLSALIFATWTSIAVAGTTDWQDLDGAKVRMAAILDPATNKISGAVEIDLKPGWKTYWRIPGEGGIPPQFNFTGSKGYIHESETLPAPKRMSLYGYEFVGYEGRTTFGFEGESDPTARDGIISLDIFMGLCEKVCIPAQASFELSIADLASSSIEAQKAINALSETKPAQPSDDFNVETATLDGDTLMIKVILPKGTKAADLFIEGYEQFRTPLPKLVDMDEREASFSMDLTKVPHEQRSRLIRATLTADKQSIETTAQVN